MLNLPDIVSRDKGYKHHETVLFNGKLGPFSMDALPIWSVSVMNEEPIATVIKEEVPRVTKVLPPLPKILAEAVPRQ